LLKNGKSLVKLVEELKLNIPMEGLDNLRITLNKKKPEIGYYSVEEVFDGIKIEVPLYEDTDLGEIRELIRDWYIKYLEQELEAEETENMGGKTLRELLRMMKLDTKVTVEDGKQLGLVLMRRLGGCYQKVPVWRSGIKMKVNVYDSEDHDMIQEIISEWYQSKQEAEEDTDLESKQEAEDTDLESKQEADMDPESKQCKKVEDADREELTLESILKGLGELSPRWCDQAKKEFEEIIEKNYSTLVKSRERMSDGSSRNTYDMANYGKICLLVGCYTFPC
jgi:hypothetical protein